MWSAPEGRSVSRGAQSIPSHWLQIHVYPHWSSLALFIMLLCNWCSIWKFPWPTPAWNKIPCSVALFFFSGSLSLFSACLSSELSMYFWDLPNLQIQLPYFPHFPQVPQAYSHINLRDPLNPCSSWASSIDTTKELVRNAESQDLLPTYQIRICVWTKSSRRFTCTLKFETYYLLYIIHLGVGMRLRGEESQILKSFLLTRLLGT